MAEPYTQAQCDDPFGFDWELTLEVKAESELLTRTFSSPHELFCDIMTCAYSRHLQCAAAPLAAHSRRPAQRARQHPRTPQPPAADAAAAPAAAPAAAAALVPTRAEPQIDAASLREFGMLKLRYPLDALPNASASAGAPPLKKRKPANTSGA